MGGIIARTPATIGTVTAPKAPTLDPILLVSGLVTTIGVTSVLVAVGGSSVAVGFEECSSG